MVCLGIIQQEIPKADLQNLMTGDVNFLAAKVWVNEKREDNPR